MQGIYSYHGPSKSVPYQYIQQSISTRNQYQHQPALMQRQRRSWKNRTPVTAPPNLTIPEHPHSDDFLFPREKHSSGYPVVFPPSKSVIGTRIHLSDIKVPPPSSSPAIFQRDPLVTTSKIPLDVSGMSNHKKRTNYALNTTTASCALSQHDSSSANQLPHHAENLTDNHHPHQNHQNSSSFLEQHRKKHHQQEQQDRHRFSATLDPQPVPPYRRFSHPENYVSQQTSTAQLYQFPHHRHSHHQQQHRPQHHHHQQLQQHHHHHQQHPYYHLAPSTHVYPPLTGYSPHGIPTQPHHHHSYYQSCQGYSHHQYHHSTAYGIPKNCDSVITDDDEDKQQRRISTNTNTDTTSTLSSSDLAPRRFSSGSTGSSGKSTLASSMGSVGIWNNDSISSASTKTTTTTMTTPAISSATAPAPSTIAAAEAPAEAPASKLDGSAQALDQCYSSAMTYEPAESLHNYDAQTTDEDNGPVTLDSAPEANVVDGTPAFEMGLPTADESNNNDSRAVRETATNVDAAPPSPPRPHNEKVQYLSASSSSTSSASSEILSPHLSATTPESTSSPSAQANPTTTTLPIWADPIKVRDNPTRYKVIQDYMAQHKLPYTSSLPLNKDVIFYFGDTKTTMVNYRSSMQKLFSSSTVWDFSSSWRRYKQSPGRKPSHMMTNQNLYCFVKGVEPMWEDEVNKHGGRLILCPGKHISLDDLFDWLLCAFVGGQLTTEGMVGLVLSRRARLDRIELWMDVTSSKNMNIIASVKNKLLKFLPVALNEPVMASHYKKHYDQ